MSCCPECALRRELLRLRGSALMRAGGFGVYRGLLDEAQLAGLRAEAMSGQGRTDQIMNAQDDEEVRGGQPAREVICVDGGELQRQLFGSPQLHAFVADAVALPIRPCGMQASYSLYSGATAHLDIHRDVPGCDLALITCLHDSEPLAGDGAIDLWVEDPTTPLGRIRADPERGRSRLALLPGDSLLIHGGMIPHRIPRPGVDRLRIVSLMCFEAVA